MVSRKLYRNTLRVLVGDTIEGVESSNLAGVKDFLFHSRYPHILSRTCSSERFVRFNPFSALMKMTVTFYLIEYKQVFQQKSVHTAEHF